MEWVVVESTLPIAYIALCVAVVNFGAVAPRQDRDVVALDEPWLPDLEQSGPTASANISLGSVVGSEVEEGRVAVIPVLTAEEDSVAGNGSSSAPSASGSGAPSGSRPGDDAGSPGKHLICVTKTPVTEFRQVTCGAMTLIALTCGLALTIGCARYGNSPAAALLRLQTYGLIGISVAGCCCLQFYRSECFKPSLPRATGYLHSWRRSQRESRSKERVMIGFWIIAILVYALRLNTSLLHAGVSQHARMWSFGSPIDGFRMSTNGADVSPANLSGANLSGVDGNGMGVSDGGFLLWRLEAIVDLVCFVISVVGLISFLKPNRPREDVDGVLAHVFDDGTGYIRPATRKPETPELTSGFMQLITFSWMNPLFSKNRSLVPDDLYRLREFDRGYAVYARMQCIWERGRVDDSLRLAKCLLRFVMPHYMYAGILKLANDSLTLLDIQLLNLVVIYMTAVDKNMTAVDSAGVDETGTNGLWLGGLLVVLMGVNSLVETALSQQYFNRMMICVLRIRSAVGTAVYVKSLKVDPGQLSGGQSKEFTSGKTINLLSTDAQRIGNIMRNIQVLWFSPYQIVIISFMLYKELRYAAFGGIVVMLSCMPITSAITKRTRRLQKAVMELKDERLRATTEAVQGIKAIKVYSWERPIIDLITAIRRKELNALLKTQLNLLLARFVLALIPVLVAVVSFGFYVVVLAQPLTPAVAFTSLALFNKLRGPLMQLPNVIMSLAETMVSVNRVQDFLNLPELPKKQDLPCQSTPRCIHHTPPVFVHANQVTVTFDAEPQYSGSEPAGSDYVGSDRAGGNAPAASSHGTSFHADNFHSDTPNGTGNSTTHPNGDHGTETPLLLDFKEQGKSPLNNHEKGIVENRIIETTGEETTSSVLFKDVSMEVRKGELLALVGRTGCGKSVLLEVLASEFHCGRKGEVDVRGRVAICTQTAWIRSGSVRDNIIMGHGFESGRYQKVVKACALEADFAILADGDLTEIGERGVNLSGGQKQRIALARAVYFDADVYLLDDVLSAVDTHVAAHIYKHVLRGLLRHKAVVMATHRFECLHSATQIYLLRPGQLPRVFSSLAEAYTDADFSQLANSDAQQSPRNVNGSEWGSPTDSELGGGGGGKVRGGRLGSGRLGKDSPRQPYRSWDFGYVGAGPEGALNGPGLLSKLVVSAPLAYGLVETAAPVASMVTTTSSVPMDEMTFDEMTVDESNGLQTVDSQVLNGAAVSEFGHGDNLSKEKRDGKKRGKPQTLVEREMMGEGQVGKEVYLCYIQAGGGVVVMALLVFLLVSTYGVSVGSTFWLSYWSDHSGKDMTVARGLGTYGAFQAAQLVLLLWVLSVLIYVSQRAARVFHTRMLYRVIHAKVQFFESNPIGRLSNKFSKDLYTIDESLPSTLYSFLSQFVNVIGVFMAIGIVIPEMVLVILPTLTLYIMIERMYVTVARQFKRIDSISRSPVFTHFSESLDGAKTIRVMKCVDQFIGHHLKWLDESMSAIYIYTVSNRWLSIRLECVGTIIVVCAGLFCIMLKSRLTGGSAGLALSYAINVTSSINSLVRLSGDRETDIIALERTIEYDQDENCPQEDYVGKPRSRNTPSDVNVSGIQTKSYIAVARSGEAKSGELATVTRSGELATVTRSGELATVTRSGELATVTRSGELATVTQSGELAAVTQSNRVMSQQASGSTSLEFKNVSLRYRVGLPFALKNVSFSITRGEKVGIVGRTGAGKSSILVCLLRLVDVTEGEILMNNRNIDRHAVDRLRMELAIIPQDPVVFTGTIKSNLDPFRMTDAGTLWEALEKACLKTFVESLPGQLEHPVFENGRNLSVGQKQLLCLARVLIRKTKILLLDEATSAVDPQTDALIQQCLRTEFKDTTIVTIAHRLKSVVDYDRVIVMDAGTIKEQGNPETLLQDRASEFYTMYNQHN
ncbi:putative multidrug resistance-associated protein 1 [Gregarina niphandrodes]|uniref:Multidrug resistance-associated protein 1 n=1 Tax=Gregarina niphandrodes TaxID=110365 RepID=A0A023BCM3_GRENI|nr:putative multidrug resistance-associated protein 1 [Gregarina niphandrodes]EZG83063.1 putative multidrug resistance-associated protein 1 [Gregarina niphandrodes]|eukprot:XP_011128967.1 putative multidrug resistance-associated protein 1 [Gregarina niphandrodes]